MATRIPCSTYQVAACANEEIVNQMANKIMKFAIRKHTIL